MRVLLVACLCLLTVPAAADPLELSGRFLIERDSIQMHPGAPDPADAAVGGILDGTWVVDRRTLTRDALVSGEASPTAPFASGFTVSRAGRALYGEVLELSRVRGHDAPRSGTAGDRIVIEAFTEGPTSDTRDSVRLVLTGPADWFETTQPGAIPDLGRATVAFEGQSLRGAALVQDRAGRAIGPIQLRRIGPAVPVEATSGDGMLNVQAPGAVRGGHPSPARAGDGLI